MKKIIFMLLFVVCLAGVTGCNETEFDPSEGVIIVGMECNYAPFNWTETQKTDSNLPIDGTNLYADGYDVQMAKLIGESLGYDVVIKMLDWNSLITALKSGMIDVVIAGMSPTEDRKQSISFTEEYYRSTHVIVTSSDSEYANVKNFADFNGAKVVGQAETSYDELAKQLTDKNTSAQYLNPLATVPEIINAINSGVADVTILEEPVAKGVCASFPGLTYFTLEDQFELEESQVIVSIGVRQNDNELRESINTALASISQTVRAELMENAINQGSAD